MFHRLTPDEILPSRNVLRIHALEAVLAVNGTRLALSFLRHHAVLANVELGTIVRMRIRRVRQDPTERPGHVAVGTNEPIVQNVPLHVLAQSAGIGRPDAAGHFVLVD